MKEWKRIFVAPEASKWISKSSLAFVFLPILLVASWFASYGSFSFLRAVPLGGTFDAMGASLLHGRLDVPAHISAWETIYSGTHTYVYWGVLPAFFRIFLNALFPKLVGLWSSVMCLSAYLLALVAFSKSTSLVLSLNQKLDDLRRRKVFCISLVSIALGTPFIWLLSASYIYHESILWGLTFSFWAMYFYLRFVTTEKRWSYLLLISLFAGLALHSRATFGVPWYLALFFLVGHSTVDFSRGKKLLILVPAATLAVLQGVFNTIRFHHPWTFIDISQQRGFPECVAQVAQFGYFNLHRMADAFKNYYGWRGGVFSSHFPFVTTVAAEAKRSDLFCTMEQLVPLGLSSPALVLGAALGLIRLRSLTWARRENFFIAGCLLLQAGVSLLLWALIERYLIEAIPFLSFLGLLFLSQLNLNLKREKRLLPMLIVLCITSVYATLSMTFTWTVEGYGVMPDETRSRLKILLMEIDEGLRR